MVHEKNCCRLACWCSQQILSSSWNTLSCSFIYRSFSVINNYYQSSFIACNYCLFNACLQIWGNIFSWNMRLCKYLLKYLFKRINYLNWKLNNLNFKFWFFLLLSFVLFQSLHNIYWYEWRIVMLMLVSHGIMFVRRSYVVI